MAEMIPESLSAAAEPTAGEKRVFRVLRDALVPDEDYLVWYEPKATSKRPDFLVWSPELGLLVIEVKDWLLAQVPRATRDRWTFLRGTVEEQHDNPLEQARRCALTYKDLLQRSPSLRLAEGFYRNTLSFPVGYCAAFTQITRRQAQDSDLLRTLEPNFCFFADDLTGDWDNAETRRAFKAKLKRSFPIQFPFEPLGPRQLETMRGLIFPEVRVLDVRRHAGPLRSESEDQLFRALDRDQERVAKSILEGHRILKGVAGSGKTLVITCRAQYLKRIRPDWRVLIVCYGIPMSRYLRQIVGISGTGQAGIEVCHYFELVKRLTGEPCGRFDGELEADWHTRIGRRLRDRLASGHITQRYDAILIDEGQDFALEWIRSLTDLLEPASDSLLFCHDPAQDIFGRKTTYKSLGIKVAGKRAIALKRSYRNTLEILGLARRFSRVPHRPANDDPDGTPEATLFPVAVERHGPPPQVLAGLNQASQIKVILDSIAEHIHARSCGWQDIAVLHTSNHFFRNNFAAAFEERFGTSRLYDVTAHRRNKRDFELASPSVKLCTIESAKGMEFRVVFLVGLDALPRADRDEPSERSLAYVGLTRAQDLLYILGGQPQGFLAELLNLTSSTP